MPTRLLLACILAASIASPSHADDIGVRMSGEARVVFEGWQELPASSPYGGPGLAQLNLWQGDGTGTVTPPTSMVGLSSLGAGAIGEPGAQAPPPGTGWLSTLDLSGQMVEPGIASLTDELRFRVTFINQTGGASGYRIWGSVALWIEAQSWSNPLGSSAMRSSVYAQARNGYGVTRLASLALDVSGSSGPHRREATVPFELVIDRAAPAFSELEIVMSCSPVLVLTPAPGSLALWTMSLPLLARRRRS